MVYAAIPEVKINIAAKDFRGNFMGYEESIGYLQEPSETFGSKGKLRLLHPNQ